MVAIERRSAPTRFARAVGAGGRPEEDLLERRDLPDLHALAARQLRSGAPRRPSGSRRPGHRSARASAEPSMTASAPQAIALTMSPRGAEAAVGDDVHVASARLVEVVAARAGDIRDRGRHRGVDAERRARRGRGSAAEADEHAGRAGAHEVQRRGVGGGAADDDRHVELVDELLEVQRLLVLRHVLGRHRGAADDEQVDAGVDDGLVELLGALRARARRRP